MEKVQMKTLRDILIVVAIIAALFAIGQKESRRVVIKTEYLPSDTVIIRDTIRDTVPVVKEIFTTRTDTVFLPVLGDTVKTGVLVPIERKIYQTTDYRATIEGYKPALVDMEIFRQVQYITKPEIRYKKTKPRWGIGLQAGYGISKSGLSPYVGIGIQYNMWCW